LSAAEKSRRKSTTAAERVVIEEDFMIVNSFDRCR
jgi:hypothetical protein